MTVWWMEGLGLTVSRDSRVQGCGFRGDWCLELKGLTQNPHETTMRRQSAIRGSLDGFGSKGPGPEAQSQSKATGPTQRPPTKGIHPLGLKLYKQCAFLLH